MEAEKHGKEIKARCPLTIDESKFALKKLKDSDDFVWR